MVAFSVLMSIYHNDKASDVSYAIDSIINQSCLPNQIVIVIDGPINKDLQDTIERYKKMYNSIETVPLAENSGLGKALSIGLQHCKNEIIARMDSDDYSLPDRFSKQIHYFVEHPEVDVLGGQIAEYDSSMQNKIAERTVPESMEEIKNGMKSRNRMNHVTVMYRKNAVLSVGNYQHCPYFEDYYLWCRMINKGYQFHNLPDVLVNVRTGDNMYQRRGGKVYNDAVVGFQKKLLQMGVINRFQYYANLGIRLSVANMPNFLRGYLYKHSLRDRKRI